MRYFLFNHEGSCNHGCEAIVFSTQKIIEKTDNNCEIILSSRHPESDVNFDNIDVVKFQTRELTFFEKIIAKLSLTLKKSEDYALKKMYSPVLKQAKNADICLSVGGDTYCYGDNYDIQLLTREMKKLGKKVVLWGASIGAEDLDEKKKKSLADFDAIFTREPLTYNLLKSQIKNDKIYLNYDPAFSLDYEKNSKKENAIGLNISPLVAKQNENIFKIADDFVSGIIKKTDYKITLVPHVVEQGNDDFEFMLPLYEKYKATNRISVLPNNLNAKEYKAEIARLRFFIGARTHATIAAYSSGVPTVVLGYSVKSRGISQYIFGEEKYILNAKEIKNSSQLSDAFEELCSNEEEIKARLENLIPLVSKSHCEMGNLL